MSTLVSNVRQIGRRTRLEKAMDDFAGSEVTLQANRAAKTALFLYVKFGQDVLDQTGGTGKVYLSNTGVKKFPLQVLAEEATAEGIKELRSAQRAERDHVATQLAQVTSGILSIACLSGLISEKTTLVGGVPFEIVRKPSMRLHTTDPAAYLRCRLESPPKDDGSNGHYLYFGDRLIAGPDFLADRVPGSANDVHRFPKGRIPNIYESVSFIRALTENRPFEHRKEW